MEKLTNEQFEKALKKSLEEIDKIIPSHFGVLLTMYKRLQFEKWLQIELFNQLAIQLKDFDVDLDSDQLVSLDEVISLLSNDHKIIASEVISRIIKPRLFSQKVSEITLSNKIFPILNIKTI